MTKIIVALDYTNPLDALEMTAKLRGHVDGFKINHAPVSYTHLTLPTKA